MNNNELKNKLEHLIQVAEAILIVVIILITLKVLDIIYYWVRILFDF